MAIIKLMVATTAKIVEEEVDFSPRLKNNFIIKPTITINDVNIELEKFIAGAEEDIVPDENGENYLKIVEAGDGAPHNHFLEGGQIKVIHNVLIFIK